MLRAISLATRAVAVATTSQSTTTPPTPTNPIEKFERDFGINLPPWLFATLTVVAAAAALSLIIKPVLSNFLVPLFKMGKKMSAGQPSDVRRKGVRRSHFADHVAGQLRRLDAKEDWRDYRFTDLEAEVEVEDFRVRRLLRRRKTVETRRRVKSLAIALLKSSERLIIVQGEPGAGKSVAMRHVASRIARDAHEAAKADSLVALYVNLKNLRPSGDVVTANDVRQYVLSTVRAGGSGDVDRYLDEEFDNGLESGTWLFLLDSFDEIPAVLNTAEVSAAVDEYIGAIHDFFRGSNQCRGIVASREFRGPRPFGWPRFTIVRLTTRQQHTLITRADVGEESENVLSEGIVTAEDTVAQLCSNPLFLSLICEHVRERGEFPDNAYDVFETYISNRMRRDEERLNSRFKLTLQYIRHAAESVAFAMTAQGLGLSPPREAIVTAVRSNEPLTKLNEVFDALEYVKIAQSSETTSASIELPSFTFAHRRIQEYFATCVVLRDSSSVDAHTLLTDGRWRETAATILQTQDGGGRNSLLAEATPMLRTAADLVIKRRASDSDYIEPFKWPPQTLHILNLLSAGLQRAGEISNSSLTTAVDTVLQGAWTNGHRHDKRLVLNVLGLASSELRTSLLSSAMTSESEILRESAYDRLSWINRLSDELRAKAFQMLIGLSCGGRLRRRRLTVRAQLRRLADPRPFLSTLNVIIAAPAIDLGCCVVGASLIFADSLTANRSIQPSTVLKFIFIALLAHSTFYLIRRNPKYSLSRPASRLEALLRQFLEWAGTKVNAPVLLSFLGFWGRVAIVYVLALGVAFQVFYRSPFGVIIAIAAASYLFAWTPSFFRVTARGKNATAFASLLYPAYEISHSTGRLTRVAQRLRNVRAKSVAVTVLVSITGIAVALSPVLLFTLGRSMGNVIFWVLVVITACYGIAMVTGLIALIAVAGGNIFANRRQRTNDLEVLRRLMQNTPPVSAATLTTTLNDLRTNEGVAALVEIATGGALKLDDCALDVFESYAATVERVRTQLAALEREYELAGQPHDSAFWTSRESIVSSSGPWAAKSSPENLKEETVDRMTQMIAKRYEHVE